MISPHAQYFVISYERNEDDRTLAATLRDIIDGQFEINPCGDLSVIRVDIEVGACADVTKDAALAVLERLTADRTNASWELRNWIETHCGALSAEHLAEAA